MDALDLAGGSQTALAFAPLTLILPSLRIDHKDDDGYARNYGIDTPYHSSSSHSSTLTRCSPLLFTTLYLVSRKYE